MRLLLRIILTGLLAWLGMLFLPLPGLWASAIAAFGVALLLHKAPKGSRYRKPKKTPRPFSFWGAFLAVLVLWAGWAFMIDAGNESVLSTRVGGIMELPLSEGLRPWALILLSGLMAGIVAGLSGLAGNWLGDAVRGS